MGSITARKGQNKMPRGGQEFEWIQLTPIAILFVIFAVVGLILYHIVLIFFIKLFFVKKRKRRYKRLKTKPLYSREKSIV